MPALLALLLPALLPVLGDGIRGIFNWCTGGSGAQPANVEEAVKLMAAESEQLKAVAALDQPAANISQWVADLRASFRYLAAGLIILGGLGLLVAWIMLPKGSIDSDFVMAYFNGVVGPVFGFMFGSRLYLELRRGSK